jgi:hypothetical protein
MLKLAHSSTMQRATFDGVMRPPRVPKWLRQRLQQPEPVWVMSERKTGVIKKVCDVQTRAGAAAELLASGLAATHRVDQW